MAEQEKKTIKKVWKTDVGVAGWNMCRIFSLSFFRMFFFRPLSLSAFYFFSASQLWQFNRDRGFVDLTEASGHVSIRLYDEKRTRSTRSSVILDEELGVLSNVFHLLAFILEIRTSPLECFSFWFLKWKPLKTQREARSIGISRMREKRVCNDGECLMGRVWAGCIWDRPTIYCLIIKMCSGRILVNLLIGLIPCIAGKINDSWMEEHFYA